MKGAICSFLILFGIATMFGQPPDWFAKIGKLQKFPATESDVKALFDSAKIIRQSRSPDEAKSLTRVVDYSLPQGELSLFLSGGKCSSTNTHGYDLDDGIILTFYFRLHKDVELSRVNLNLGGFRSERETDTEHVYFYNPSKGVRYTFLGDKLQAINFSLPERYYRNCENRMKK